MTPTDTLYYLCQSEDAASGLFGTADECAAWYLTFGGAACRVYRHGGKTDHGTSEQAATNVRMDNGRLPVWTVAFKTAHGSCYLDSPITVTGENEEEAEKALRRHIVETRLRANPGADENFYMVSAEQALPVLMWAAEMREIYDLAGQPPTENEKDVKKWFWNTEHSKQGLSRMVDCLVRRRRMELSPVHAALIKAQIDALPVTPGMLMQHKASAAPAHHSADRVLS